MTRKQRERVADAREVLSDLDFDAARSNARSALTLLALLDLRPDRSWPQADGGRLWTIHAQMQWMRDHYDKDYAVGSRESIRRQTLHQFVDAGLVLNNPDDPARAVNSSANCYQIAPAALALLRTVGCDEYAAGVAAYLEAIPSMRTQYARQRELNLIRVTFGSGEQITLTPGGQNVLIKEMIEVFCPRWTPGGRMLDIGDAGREDPIFDADGFASLGVVLDKHGKLPDLVVHLPDRDWLVLMEAAPSHGPVDAKRHGELSRLFSRCTAGLVFVSCFPSRAELRKYLVDIAWETEAWCADNPDHLIHFNGQRFLGPYDPPPGQPPITAL